MATPVEQLAELARSLHSQPTSEQTLEHAVQAAVDLVDSCEWAGVSLTRRGKGISSSAATDRVPIRSVEVQQDLDEGPCLDAAWDYPVIHVRDLTTEHRWTRWAAQVHEELGVGSVMCLQLFTHEDRLGVLSLYSSQPHAFDSGEEELAFTVAAQAAVALAAAEQVEQLGDALGSRTVIGQALGLTMHRFGLTGDQAFGVLRRLSNEQNRKLVVLAKETVEEWETSGVQGS